MGAYDQRDKKTTGQPPTWQSSDGRLREASPTPRKDGKDHQTGYRPKENEGRARPRETGRMAGSYGDVSVGVSRKKELTMVVSQRRARDGVATTEDEKEIKGDSAKRINLIRGNSLVNSHDGKKSAVAYRESHKKQPNLLLGRFRELMQKQEQHTLEEQVPFLTREPEKETLGHLREEENRLRAQGGAKNRHALARVEAQKQKQRQSITEKEGQERRLRLLLQKAQEESRRQAGEGLWTPILEISDLPAEEPPPEGEETPKRSAVALEEETEMAGAAEPEAEEESAPS